MAVPRLFDYLTKRREVAAMPQHTGQPDGETTATVTGIPKIDSNDVIGSLNGILGPSPEERAEEEKRLQQHRKKMHGWTALFNGLRHLGNLYYATKGAPGQKFNDPHAQIEQQYQDERKRLADIHAADRNYYANLWGLYRQMNDEQRKNALAEAQAQYYGTRDEVVRLKAENDRLKAEAAARNTDARTKYAQERTKTEQELRGGKKREVESRIDRYNRTGTGAKKTNDGGQPSSKEGGKKANFSIHSGSTAKGKFSIH